MTQRVWKFPFELKDDVEIQMPTGARVVHVGSQHNIPMLWALCDAEAEVEARCFRVAGTGHPIPESVVDNYVGTFMMMGGHLVWHVFERPGALVDATAVVK
jgi:hypothetical protein